MIKPLQPPKRRGDLWPHQQAAYCFAEGRPAAMLSMWMGTGKTKTTIDLVQNWGCQTILVLCPVSVMGVWRREFGKWYVGDVSVYVADKGSSTIKAKRIREHMATATRPVVVVVNYESARTTYIAKELLGRDWDLVILDESHRAKAHNSQISKTCWQIGKRAARRLCLTGTPMPNCPLDLFGQFRFLDASIFGTSWHRFRSEYAILQQIPGVMVPIVKGYKNQAQLQEHFARLAYSVDASVLHLPPITQQRIDCELSSAARRAYRAIENDLIAEMDAGVVTASNALVRLVRLQQITSGWIPVDETRELLECDKSKRAALIDLIADMPADQSVVVFGRFTSDLRNARHVAEELRRPYCEISGACKDLDEHSQMLDLPGQVLGVQIQSGGVGIDLTAARYAIFHSAGFSLGEFDQAIARLHRPGQSHHVHVFHLVCPETIDVDVYKAIELKRDIVESVLEGLKQSQATNQGKQQQQVMQ